MKKWGTFSLFLAYLLSVSLVVWARGGEQLPAGEFSRYQEIAGKLRCPTCTGLSVLESDASFSVQIRNTVADQIAAGKNSEQILEFFTDRYGLWILREPPQAGVHLVIWLIPVALLVGGFLIWVMFFLRQRRRIMVQRRSREEIEDEFFQRLQRLVDQ